MSAALIAVMPPIAPTTVIASCRRVEDREHARDEVDAGRDHRRGVDQGAETGVGPSIASGSQTCSGTCADLPAAPAKMPSAKKVSVVLPMAPASASSWISAMSKVPACCVDQQDRQQEAEVAEARDEEGLLGGRGGGRPVEPEADEQVGREADHLPEDVDQQEAVERGRGRASTP